MKHRGSCGTAQHLEYASPRIRKGLLNALGAFQPTPRVERKERIQGRPPLKAEDPITDAVLARMRGDHELRGVPASKLAAEHGISLARCKQLLSYTNRAHIEAA